MMSMTSEEALEVQRYLFKQALEVVEKKRRDYASENDPFRNFRASVHVGVEPWRGALVRLMDKIARISRIAERGGERAVQDESLLDTVVDALNYIVIAYCLIREEIHEGA